MLVVDDNATNRRLLTALLAGWQVEHRSASGGAAALDLLKQEPCQLVLLDVNLPDASGFEVAAKIRERWSQQEIKIALLTAMGHAATPCVAAN